MNVGRVERETLPLRRGGGAVGARPPVPAARLMPPVLSPRAFAWLRALLFAAALLPLVRLFWLGAAGGLGPNPVEFVIRSLGTWALVQASLSFTRTQEAAASSHEIDAGCFARAVTGTMAASP